MEVRGDDCERLLPLDLLVMSIAALLHSMALLHMVTMVPVLVP